MFSSVVDDVITVGGFARIWQRIYISRRPFGISAASTIQLTRAKQTFDYVHFIPNERKQVFIFFFISPASLYTPHI
jgi:hypothetical protein